MSAPDLSPGRWAVFPGQQHLLTPGAARIERVSGDQVHLEGGFSGRNRIGAGAILATFAERESLQPFLDAVAEIAAEQKHQVSAARAAAEAAIYHLIDQHNRKESQ